MDFHSAKTKHCCKAGSRTSKTRASTFSKTCSRPSKTRASSFCKTGFCSIITPADFCSKACSCIRAGGARRIQAAASAKTIGCACQTKAVSLRLAFGLQAGGAVCQTRSFGPAANFQTGAKTSLHSAQACCCPDKTSLHPAKTNCRPAKARSCSGSRSKTSPSAKTGLHSAKNCCCSHSGSKANARAEACCHRKTAPCPQAGSISLCSGRNADSSFAQNRIFQTAAKTSRCSGSRAKAGASKIKTSCCACQSFHRSCRARRGSSNSPQTNAVIA